ncbi:GNAT family N-acetyltransferase [Plantactinospora sonchi]|uniref:GNAT family N-acetyltransferase n=1 Tax=Plantactinospora sonchi TaxID=1544735 RepID=A0ABU7RKI8_9ACTN
MKDTAHLLRLYDEQLRTEAETAGAMSVARLGPLRLATFEGGRGFITYPYLGDPDADAVDRLVPEALDHYRSDPAIVEVEWKTRGHDPAPGLHEALVRNGFLPGDPESVMVGEISALVADVPLPTGVTLRRVTEEQDVRAMSAMSSEVFGDAAAREMADGLLRRLRLGTDLELWVAEADGRMIGAGRLEPVADSDFAGLWGGAVRKPWRGRGIYRALTAARARAALAGGRTLVHSDSTEYSRPILERSGLVKVSTTTPYLWRR